MDNYEINILRRGGNWKKVKPDDLIIDEINNDIDEINNELNHDNELNHQKSYDDFLSYVTKIDFIISRLEALEDEKNKLKEELKIFENKFFDKKKLAEDEINKISQEKEMIEKTLNVIKNLKSF
tara:strand:+ start:298 stop:669 length:372 start_codon:yes stop_codon:yes gene_type:complete